MVSAHQSPSPGFELDDERPTPAPLSLPTPRLPRTGGDAEEPGPERQLAIMFGDTVFGPWLDPRQYLSATRTHRRGRRLRRLAALLAILGLASATGWLIRTGYLRKSAELRGHTARSLARFLQEGEMSRVAQYLQLLRGPRDGFDRDDPHLDLMIRSEAALYRYHDADPSRLARIKPHLPSPGAPAPSAARLLAALVLASRQERATQLVQLLSVRQVFERDPEYHYLLATAFERRGDVAAARRAWQRSLELGPLWLPHRYEQAWFEAQQNEPALLRKIVDGLVRVAPAAPWTQLARERFLRVQADSATTLAGAGADSSPPGVVTFHRNFAAALASATELTTSWRSLGLAVAAIHGQAPFVFDAFDWLLAAKATGLAHALTGLPAWPAHSPPAIERLEQLALRGHPADETPEVTFLPTVRKADVPTTTSKKKLRRSRRDKPRIRRRR